MKDFDIKIKRDSEKEYKRIDTNSGFRIVYPKFKAEGKFFKKKIEFSNYDTHNRVSVKFPEEKSFLKNRNEYGEDLLASDGSMIVLRYKLDTKGQKIVTEFEVIQTQKSI